MPSITLTDPVTNTTVASGLIATNNANLRNLLNSGLDPVNLKGNPTLASGEFPVWDGSQFVSSGVLSPTGLMPTGTIVQFAAASAPTGWSLCDGSSVLRSGTFAALFAVIGTTYGSVDGTHFTLPDLRGRIPVGFAATGGHTDVSALGNSDGVSTANRRPKHRHTPHSHTLPNNVVGNTGATWSFNGPAVNISVVAATNTADGGSGNANDSLDAPAYLVVNYIIKQ